MLSKFFQILSLLLPLGLLGQVPVEHLSPLNQRSIPQTSKLSKKATQAVSLPFFDDFSYDSHRPNPALWDNQATYINQTLAIDPPTLGVATFDGLNQIGLAYDLSRLQAIVSTDTLISKEIDLTNTLDSVYLSFFYQAGGRGESVEFDDSLSVEFYNAQDSNWYSVWRIQENSATDFRQVLIPVADTFHSDQFRFRFRSYGSPAGAYDNWHIDYVRLDDQRNFQDTAFTDLAFTAPHPNLLVEYTAIPYFHFNSVVGANFKSALTFNYQRNLAPNNTLNPNLGVYEISYNGNVLAQNLTGSPGLDPNRQDNQPGIYVVDNLNYLPTPDLSAPFSIDAFQTYNLASANRSTNDTVRISQQFENFYAYDDGTAERSYFVDNNDGGFILTRYQFLQADSLQGIYMYCLPTNYDVQDAEFSIVVYEDNNGLPGDLLYESDSIHAPVFTNHNTYWPYALEKAVYVNRDVFIGIRQQSARRITIGYDVNTADQNVAEIFFGQSNNYFQSSVFGSLMMRPYFRFNPANISLPEVSTADISVYPNPTNGRLHLSISEEGTFSYQLFNLNGQRVQAGTAEPQLHLQNLPKGIYLIRITEDSGKFAPFTTKIVLQ